MQSLKLKPFIDPEKLQIYHKKKFFSEKYQKLNNSLQLDMHHVLFVCKVVDPENRVDKNQSPAQPATHPISVI